MSDLKHHGLMNLLVTLIIRLMKPSKGHNYNDEDDLGCEPVLPQETLCILPV